MKKLAGIAAAAATPTSATETARPHPPAERNIRLWHRKIFRYAAVLVLLAGSFYFWTMNKKSIPAEFNPSVQTDAQPGGNRATLVLADGRVIPLDSAANGILAQQGNAAINKLVDGQIVYQHNGKANSAEILNTMRTPRGGQYQLTLPDGTRIWLNAASSITYPATFTGPNRTVKISGEVYFEVTTNKSMPFIVQTEGNSTIEVLGTHFNVNSYTDEAQISTTLLEGSVLVRNGVKFATLRPGQQARCIWATPDTNPNSISVIDGADLEQVIAWKEGLFNFNGANVQTVMRQLERWYDVQVEYEGKAPTLIFRGKMYRNVALSQVIAYLQKMNIKIKLEGKTILIGNM